MAERGVSAPSGIFISYRRQETAYAAGWLYQQLRDRFGSDQIFKDVDNLDPGDDFYDKIDEAVGSCAVLLALIGDRWLDVVDDAGARRLDDSQDFVRLEIEAALRRGVRVVPLLVNGARMPRSDAVPSSLAGLTRRHALELSPERFESDTQRLLGVLERTLVEARSRNAAADAASPAPPVTGHGAADAADAAPAAARTAPDVPPGAPPGATSDAPPTVTVAVADGPEGGDDRGPHEPERDAVVEPSRPSATDAATPLRFPPSIIPLWSAGVLVAAALLVVWASWPGVPGSTRAWKDENLSGWFVYRTWNDAVFWSPLIAAVAAAGAAWSRTMLGAVLGASTFTLATAVMILVGGLSSDQTAAWLTTLALTLLIVSLCLWNMRAGVARRARVPVPALAFVLLGCALWFAADAVDHDGYDWLRITHGAGAARQLLLLAVAAPVLLDVGGRYWRPAYVSAAVTTVLVGLIDLAPAIRTVGDTIIALRLMSLAAYGVGVALAVLLHRRAEMSGRPGAGLGSF